MRRALIIGASGGIGAAVARELASRGWALVLHGRDKERLLRVETAHLRVEPSGSKTELDAGPGSSSVNARLEAGRELLLGDVVAWAADPKTIPAIAPVDAVVWCAGVCELVAGQMLGLAALRRTLAVNLEAPLVVCSHFYRKGVIKDGGTLVLIGSEAAHDAGEGFAAYAASKGGLAAAARVLAKEYAPLAGSGPARRQVRVVCLEPGTVDTPMTRRIIATFGGLKGGHMERMVPPEAVAAQVALSLD